METGWICPVCGSGRAPSENGCPCVKDEKDRLERAKTVKLWRDKDGNLVPADELLIP